MAKKVMLNQKERIAVIMFAERYEGTKVEIKRMDKALDRLDKDAVSDLIIPTPGGGGLMIKGGLEVLENKFEAVIFEDAEFTTLHTFLKEQRLPYSRRADTIGRLIVNVLDKMGDAKTVEVKDDESGDS